MSATWRGDGLDDLRAALHADPGGFATHLLGNPTRATRRSRREMRFGSRSGSLVVTLDGPWRATWRDHQVGVGGDMLDLAMHERSCGFPEAVAEARAWSGIGPVDGDRLRERPVRVRMPRVPTTAEEARLALAQRETADRIEKARGLWDGCVPIAGTLAESYLLEARKVEDPGRPWPPRTVGYHPGQRALVVAARTADGEVQAVQCIYLTAGAEKDLARGRRGKLSFGPQEGTVVMLPGSQPTLVAEGPETGLTAWAATGQATVMTLGSLSKYAPAPGGTSVLLAEHHGPVGMTMTALAARRAEWAVEGAVTALCTPWADPRPYDGSDLNDVARELGNDAVRARIALAVAALPPPRGTDAPPPGTYRMTGVPGHTYTGLPPAHPFITEGRDEALARQRAEIRGTVGLGARIGAARRDLVRRRVAELALLPGATPVQKAGLTRRLIGEVAAAHGFGRRIPPPVRVLVTGSQGTGKTATALEALAEVRGRVCAWVTEPSLQKCLDNLADYRRVAGPGSLPALVVRGRAQMDPGRPGLQMCRRSDVADRMARNGIAVGRVMCPTCPYRDDCGYRDQDAAIARMDGVGIFLLTSANLFVKSRAPTPDVLVSDERVDPASVSKVPLDAMHPGLFPLGVCGDMGTVTQASQDVMRVRECLIDPAPLAALTRALIDKRTLRKLVRLLALVAEPDASALSGDRTDAELGTALDAIEADPRAVQALSLLRAVVAEFDLSRLTLTGVSYDPESRAFVVSRHRRLHGLARASVAALDGSGNVGHARQLFGSGLRHVEARVERNAYVVGTTRWGKTGRGYSARSITGLNGAGEAVPSLADPSLRTRLDIAAVVARMPAPCLVVGSMAVEARLREVLPPDTPTAHYNALRGSNAWETCPSAVIVGANNLALRDLEAMGRAYMAADPQPFMPCPTQAVPDDYEYADRGWPYWCSMMRRMRDGSVCPVEVPCHPDPRVQALFEQLREAEVLQAADRPRPIFNRRSLVLANSLALDITYDRIMDHQELAAGGARPELAYADAGLLPLSGRDLHRTSEEGGWFPSERAAGHCVSKWLKSQTLAIPSVLLIDSTGAERGNAVLFAYRRRGQRGVASRVVVDTTRHPDPRAALEAFLGQLVLFEPVAPEVPVAAAVPAVETVGAGAAADMVEPSRLEPVAVSADARETRVPVADVEPMPPLEPDDGAEAELDAWFIPGPWKPIPWIRRPSGGWPRETAHDELLDDSDGSDEAGDWQSGHGDGCRGPDDWRQCFTSDAGVVGAGASPGAG